MSDPRNMLKEIPDQTGKVVIVTGGNSGIGKVTCEVLLDKGAQVYMGARSRERAEAAIEEIKTKTGKTNIQWLDMDLSSLASVKAAAEHFKRQERELHQLYNNAGIMDVPLQITKDGYEVQWGTNVVGHFAFTKLLLPVLESTAASNPPGTVRVVNLSSEGHNVAPSGGIFFQDLSLETGSIGFNIGKGWSRYGQSKLGNILLTKEITRRYADKGIYSIAVHPGVVRTSLLGQSTSFMSRWVFQPVLNRFFALDVESGAITQLVAGTSQRIVAENLNGAYMQPFAQVGTPSAYARDAALAQKLWDTLEAEVTPKLASL